MNIKVVLTAPAMADNQDEEGEEVQLAEVIASQEELEDTANAVLGDSDDTNCSYSRGYVQRQALYACTTCVPIDSSPAGVCLACSLCCHEGHKLVEMYTKRYFRCDCGNKRFPTSFSCQLTPVKDDTNEKNSYNHNFSGLYCTCNRPYPDSEDEVEDEMIQCVVCEDWFHSRHLGCPPPSMYQEMVCDGCMARVAFLRAHQIHTTSRSNEEGEVNVQDSGGDNKPSSSTPPSNQVVCGFVRRKELMGKSCVDKGPGYFTDGWRSELCHCDNCQALYKEKKVTFLCEKGDSVAAYEARGAQRQYTHDAGMDALSSGLSHVQHVEMVHEYKHMTSELKTYLEPFAREGKVVRQRDIDEFFEEMKAKRRRSENGDGIPPYSCR